MITCDAIDVDCKGRRRELLGGGRGGGGGGPGTFSLGKFALQLTVCHTVVFRFFGRGCEWIVFLELHISTHRILRTKVSYSQSFSYSTLQEVRISS